jgi:hypothetical protein
MNDPVSGVARSTFVNVVAWIFIVLTGFSTLIGILQNIMVQTVFRSADFAHARAASQADANMPPAIAFMTAHMEWFFLATLLMSATTLVASIGLLKRLDWARWLFIAILGLGIAWQGVGLALQATMHSAMTGSMAGAPADFRDQFQTLFVLVMVVSAVFGLALAVLFGWIIQRLLSPAIAAEFRG